jgi:uncharacterized protein YciI
MATAKLALLGLLLAPTVYAETTKGRGHMSHDKPTMTWTLTYAGGPQWKPGLPPEQQDIGAHLAWVKKLFEQKKLVANGHLANGRGFYVFSVSSSAEIEKVASSDPGIDSGVLQLEAAAPWSLMFDNLSEDVSGKELFVVNYRPGRSWQGGRTLIQQDVGAHMGYVQKAFADGTLLAGGPVDDHQGRYIVAAANQAAVERWVEADPAVASRLLHAEIIGWQAFNRQTTRH